MFEDHVESFVESRIEKLDITNTQSYHIAIAGKEEAKAALQSFFTDAKIGNKFLEEYDNACYAQSVTEMEAAYRQGFVDGMKLLSTMGAPIGRDA